jgi:hypothetical protein
MPSLTKDEWITKVYRDYARIHHVQLPDHEDRFWWYRTGKNRYMRLSEKGFERFQQSEIPFYQFEIEVPVWTASLLLGITRMPSPHYFVNRPKNSMLYLADESIAVQYRLIDNIEIFARGF